MKKTTSKNTLVKVLCDTCDTKNGIVKLVELHRVNGKMFKFIFENSNGTPLGFDYKHCAKVFNTDSDEWKNVGDKDGIRIYEGDILNVESIGNLFVWYNKEHCQFELRRSISDGGFVDKLWQSNKGRYTVEGNIFDTPELLK